MTLTDATNGICSGTRPATNDERGPMMRIKCTGPPVSASSCAATDSKQRTILDVEIAFTFFHPFVVVHKNIQRLGILLFDLGDLTLDQWL